MILNTDILIKQLTDLGSTVVENDVDLILKGLDDSLTWLMDDQFLIVPLGVL